MSLLRTLIFSLAASLLLSFSPAEGATLHAILAGHIDCHCYTLGLANKLDVTRVKHELRRMAVESDMSYNPIKHYGEGFQKELVLQSIRDLSVEKEDIVVFFLSGHGCKSEGLWPQLFFGHKTPPLPLEEVATELANKGARLTVVLADVSHGPFPTSTSASSHFQWKPAPSGPKLFREFEGVIIACASSSGEEAYSGENGSLFTTALVNAIRLQLISENPNWEEVFDLTKREVIDRQHPVVRFYKK